MDECASPHHGRPRLRWDIFCHVIDNFGDIGVCWRLACDLAARGQQVCLWLDDARALAWMAPCPWPQALRVRDWQAAHTAGADDVDVGDVLAEAFGCTIPAPFVERMARRAPVWINLEYLTAQSWAGHCHRLPSPLMAGPGAGLTRWFFYPGFTPDTGGLLREAGLAARQQAFGPGARARWRAACGVAAGERVLALFCYDSASSALAQWLARWPALGSARWHMLVTPGHAARAVRQARAALPGGWPAHVHIHERGFCKQAQFDEMLWASDCNIVRGEDSLVRALWAGQPFIWNIYPQSDQAHHAKLHAFLDWLQAPASLRAAHCALNGLPSSSDWPAPDTALLHEWQQCVQAARARLLAQPPLGAQLLDFACAKWANRGGS